MGEGQPASRHWDCNARESADVEGLRFAARREKLEVLTGPGSGAGVRLCGEGCDAPQPPPPPACALPTRQAPIGCLIG